MAGLCAGMIAATFFASSALADRTYDSQLTGAPGTATVPGPFSGPRGLAVDGSDNLWVANVGAGGLVDKFDSSGNFLAQGDGGGNWTGEYTESIAYSDASQHLYVADSNHDDVWLLKASAGYDFDLTGPWGTGCCYIRTAADNSPGATRGDVYIAGQNASVYRIDGSGAAANFTAGSAAGKSRLTGADTPAGSFGTISGLAVDSSGNLFVTDNGNRVIDEFAPSGAYLGSITGAGAPSSFASGSLLGVAVDPSNEDVLVVDGGNNVVDEFESNGAYVGQMTGTGPSEETPFGSLSGGIAVNSAGFVYVSDGGSKLVDVFTPNKILPKIAYGSVTNQTQTSGTVNATIDPNGVPVISCHFEYGTSTNYGLGSIPCDPDPAENPPATDFTTSTPVSAELSGLTTETTYHYRVVVSNANGTRKGPDRTYLPHAVAGLATEPADPVARNCATLNGTFNGNGEDTHYQFEWGTGTGYGHTTSLEDAGTSVGARPIDAEVCGLTVETVYHFRVTASNSAGTSHGEDQSFETLAAVEHLETKPATNVRGSVATLNGSWSGDGSDTHYLFEWGTTTSYEHDTAAPPGVDAGSGSGTENQSFQLTELSPNTTYHFRIVASNATGTSYGEAGAFTTLALPVITNQFPTQYKTESVQLNALINPASSGETTYHVVYASQAAFEVDGLQGAPTTPESQSVGSDESDHAVSVELAELAPGTAYHYRFIATSPAGTASGSEGVITTVPLTPQVAAETSSEDIATRAVTLSAAVNPGFGTTTYRFQYGPTAEYGEVTFPVQLSEANGTNQPAAVILEKLIPGITYHYRVVASNWGGTAYGPDQTFETSSAPTLGELESEKITQSTATIVAGIKPGLRPTTYHVEYGTTAAYGARTAESSSVGSDNSTHEVTVDLNGLPSSTTIHYRFIATNSVGSTASLDQTFKTSPAAPQLPTPLTCPKGKVKRNGKCVKKPHHRRHHRKRKGHRHA